MHTMRLTVLSVLVLMLAACASQQSTPSKPSATQPGGQPVKSRDGTFTGEVVGTAAPGSKFARLQIGMQMKEVQDILGRAPDRLHTYESGKRWIPFYFGNDVRRMQVLFSGEGCLVFSDGNVWGAAGGDLIAIHHDSTGRCYQP
jgi:hypothetical protein